MKNVTLKNKNKIGFLNFFDHIRVDENSAHFEIAWENTFGISSNDEKKVIT